MEAEQPINTIGDGKNRKSFTSRGMRYSSPVSSDSLIGEQQQLIVEEIDIDDISKTVENGRNDKNNIGESIKTSTTTSAILPTPKVENHHPKQILKPFPSSFQLQDIVANLIPEETKL